MAAWGSDKPYSLVAEALRKIGQAKRKGLQLVVYVDPPLLPKGPSRLSTKLRTMTYPAHPLNPHFTSHLPEGGPDGSFCMKVTQKEVEAKGDEIFPSSTLPDAESRRLVRMMEWSMGNEALVHPFRGRAARPESSVIEHMQEYFGGGDLPLAGPLKLGLGMSKLTPWLVGPTVQKSVAWRVSSSPGARVRRPCRC